MSLDYRERLKIFREDEGVSARKMALAIDVDPSHYLKVEKLQRGLLPEQIKELEIKYNVSAGWIITGRGDMRLKGFAEEKQITHQGLPEIITTNNYDRLYLQLMNEGSAPYGKENNEGYVTRAEYSILQTMVMKLYEEVQQLKKG